MPEGAVYVGRGTWWGNPFRPYSMFRLPSSEIGLSQCESDTLAHLDGCCGGHANCLAWYRIWLTAQINLRARMGLDFLDRIRGRDLACWCPLDQPCHADVLLELANR